MLKIELKNIYALCDSPRLSSVSYTHNRKRTGIENMGPPHCTTVTDFVTDADVAGNGHSEGALGAPSTLGVSTSSANVSVARTGANATFRNGAALRYPVWKVILDFAK